MMIKRKQLDLIIKSCEEPLPELEDKEYDVIVKSMEFQFYRMKRFWKWIVVVII